MNYQKLRKLGIWRTVGPYYFLKLMINYPICVDWVRWIAQLEGQSNKRRCLAIVDERQLFDVLMFAVCAAECLDASLSCALHNASQCCHPTCLGGCMGPGPGDCLVCRNFRHNNTCIGDCPADLYGASLQSANPVLSVLFRQTTTLRSLRSVLVSSGCLLSTSFQLITRHSKCGRLQSVFFRINHQHLFSCTDVFFTFLVSIYFLFRRLCFFSWFDLHLSRRCQN